MDDEVERAAEQLVLNAFLMETILELARQQSDPSEWVNRFIERLQRRIDWFEMRDWELGLPGEGAAYARARTALVQHSGSLRVRLLLDE